MDVGVVETGENELLPGIYHSRAPSGQRFDFGRRTERHNPIAQDGDLVLTLGAGNVWQAGDLLLGRLQREEVKAG